MRFHFHNRYFFLTLILFVVEVLIALFVHDDIVRPYVGDFLVVALIYCFVRTFTALPMLPVAVGVLLFAFLVEAGQYFHLLSLLGWEHSVLAKIVLGNSFAWIDLVMYTAGILFVITIEIIRKKLRDTA